MRLVAREMGITPLRETHNCGDTGSLWFVRLSDGHHVAAVATSHSVNDAEQLRGPERDPRFGEARLGLPGVVCRIVGDHPAEVIPTRPAPSRRNGRKAISTIE